MEFSGIGDSQHLAEKKYKCESCSEEFTQLTSLRLHCEGVHEFPRSGVSAHLPSSEEMVFSGVQDLQPESESQPSAKTYPCELCGKEFKRIVSLGTHCRHVHKFTNSEARQLRIKLIAIDPSTIINPTLEELQQLPDPVFSCDLCDAEFTNPRRKLARRQLIRHRREHKCPFCDVEIGDGQELLSHIQYYHTENAAQFAEEGELPPPGQSHSTESLPGSRDLQPEGPFHWSGRPGHYVCDLCGYEFLQMGDLIRHRRDAHKCPFCDVEFGDGQVLMSHIKQYHTENTAEHPNQNHTSDQLPAYTCHFCGAKFLQIKHLMEHRRDAHTCSFCHMEIGDSEQLQSHLLDHSGDSSATHFAGELERPNPSHSMESTCNCTFCGEEFSELGNLMLHRLDAHTCPVCHMEIGDNEQLQSHVLDHSADRSATHLAGELALQRPSPSHLIQSPGKSALCSAEFSQIGNLMEHRRIPSDEKPFKDELRGADFLEQKALDDCNPSCSGKKPSHTQNHSIDSRNHNQTPFDEKERSGERRRHSRSRSGERRRHSRSYSGERRRHSRSHSGERRRHSRSHSGERRRHSRSHSGERRRHSRSHSGERRRHSRSHSGERRRRNRSHSGERRRRSRSHSSERRLSLRHSGKRQRPSESCSRKRRRFRETSSSENRHRSRSFSKDRQHRSRTRSSERRRRSLSSARVSERQPINCKVDQSGSADQSSVRPSRSLSHPAETEYKCDLCGAAFAEKGTLQQHNCTKAVETLYKCELCSAEFSGSEHLKRHSRVHLLMCLLEM